MEEQLIHKHIEQILPEDSVKFCMPGHRERFKNYNSVDPRILRYDITELDGADNLQIPQSILKDAQIRAARVFNAQHSFYSVNGSTACVNAAILSTCRHGDKILVDRSCHISVMNAIVFAGAVPVFIERSRILEFDVDGGVSAYKIQKELEEAPEIKAVFITSPTYYGICSDISSIAKIVHEYKIPLIVDEAHGSHLIFSENLPLSATESGADVVINSLHKTLPCVTQGAIIHVNTDRVDHTTVKEFLNMFQTTSPSYLIMSSIDSACALMQNRGSDLWNQTAKLCRKLMSKIDGFRGIKILGSDQVGTHDVFDTDPTRLVINFNRTSITAREVAEQLSKKYKIFCEMVDRSNIVNIVTVGNTNKHLDYFKKRLLSILKNAHELPGNIYFHYLKHGKKELNPNEAFYSDKRLISIHEALGKISARSVYAVPPGSTVLYPGEEITQETIDFLVSVHNIKQIWVIEH